MILKVGNLILLHCSCFALIYLFCHTHNKIIICFNSQVFDSDGIFTKEFGSYGNAEGEFDCLAGVAVNRIGQFIIADRYNHRIQVSC